jgi:4'-phosphopantetheinyl transferase EntD
MRPEALRALSAESVAVPRGAHREPRWPPGIVGSLSHASGFCGAVVARDTLCRGLGFDVEAWGRMRPALWRPIATPGEREWLAAQAGDGERWATLLFSAKEALYTAQYPRSSSPRFPDRSAESPSSSRRGVRRESVRRPSAA